MSASDRLSTHERALGVEVSQEGLPPTRNGPAPPPTEARSSCDYCCVICYVLYVFNSFVLRSSCESVSRSCVWICLGLVNWVDNNGELIGPANYTAFQYINSFLKHSEPKPANN